MKPALLNIVIEFAKQYEIDWRILFSILKKESGADGFKDGKIKCRYEDHIFNGLVDVIDGAKKHPGLPGLDVMWIRKHDANEIVMLSTSYGIAQIMGYWYPMLGYESIDAMVDDWKASEEIQIRKFCEFVVKYNKGKFLKALQQLDFVSIAKQFNGAGYKKNNYDVDLEKYFKECKQ